MKFFNFFAQFFQDQDGNSSSKRLAAYVLLIYLGMLVNASIHSKAPDFNTLIVVAGLLALCLGVITAEFLTKFKNGTTDKNGA